MTVEMGIRNRDTGEYRVVTVAGSKTFERVWLPACQELNLELVSHFHDGMLTRVEPEDIPRIIEELQQLRAWAAAKADLAFVVERIDTIVKAFSENDPRHCEFDFG
jgi:hypothetical protein